MPNARELTKMFKDIQELIPAVVGAIIAIATAIGLLIPSLEGELSSNTGAGNGSPSNSTGGFSTPETAGPNYLTDHANNIYPHRVKYGHAVTVDGKNYEKSILSTDGDGDGKWSSVGFNVSDEMKALTLKAAWVDTIPNSGGTGKVLVKRDNQVLDRFSVEPGQIVDRKIDVRGGGTVTIMLSAVDHTPDKKPVEASGLAILTPVLK